MGTYTDASGTNPVKHNYVVVNNAGSGGVVLYTCPSNATAYVVYMASGTDNLQISRPVIGGGESLVNSTQQAVAAPGAGRAFIWNPYGDTPTQHAVSPETNDPHSTTNVTPGRGQDNMPMLFPGDQIVKNVSGSRIYLKILEIGML